MEYNSELSEKFNFPDYFIERITLTNNRLITRRKLCNFELCCTKRNYKESQDTVRNKFNFSTICIVNLITTKKLWAVMTSSECVLVGLPVVPQIIIKQRTSYKLIITKPVLSIRDRIILIVRLRQHGKSERQLA